MKRVTHEYPSRAAEEGIIPGGGVALLRTLPALSKLKLTGEQQYGVNIICRALEEPVRQIAQNGGAEGAVVVNKVREGKDVYGRARAEARCSQVKGRGPLFAG